jgi:hypothetical protein
MARLRQLELVAPPSSPPDRSRDRALQRELATLQDTHTELEAAYVALAAAHAALQEQFEFLSAAMAMVKAEREENFDLALAWKARALSAEGRLASSDDLSVRLLKRKYGDRFS